MKKINFSVIIFQEPLNETLVFFLNLKLEQKKSIIQNLITLLTLFIKNVYFLDNIKYIERLKRMYSPYSSPAQKTNSNELINRSTVILIIITIGTIGNVINIIVFSNISMRKVSTFRYLFYLAIFDLLLILVCATDALITHGSSKMPDNRFQFFLIFFSFPFLSLPNELIFLKHVICPFVQAKDFSLIFSQPNELNDSNDCQHWLFI